jgi:hypothetical protein
METVHQSFIHVTPVAEAHLSNASPFQTPLITPKQQTDQTNKQRQLPSRVMSNYVQLHSTGQTAG